MMQLVLFSNLANRSRLYYFFAVLVGRKAVMLLKEPAKGAETFESNFVTNIAYGLSAAG